MLTLFRYNWQVRDEWFEWCRQRTAERAECQPDWRSWRHSGDPLSYRRRRIQLDLCDTGQGSERSPVFRLWIK